jgi:hypothetical protein
MKTWKKAMLITIGFGLNLAQYKTQTSSSWNGNNMGLSVIDCSAFGFDALRLGPNTAFGNTAVGHETLRFNTTGEQNTGLGTDALWLNITGNNNTAVGFQALMFNDSPPAQGDNNTAIGRTAMRNNVAGDENAGIGVDAILSNAGGNRNTADGYQAFFSPAGTGPTFVYDNTILGYKAFRGNTIGGTSIENTAVGALAASENIVQSFNTIVGNEAFLYKYANQSNENTAVGHKVMSSWNSVGFGISTNNTSMGSESMKNNHTSANNVAFGRRALYGDVNGMGGIRNVALGFESAYKMSSGFENVAVGNSALYSNKTQDKNTGIGDYALFSNTNGIQNTAVGKSAGFFIDEKCNTVIGDNADVSSASGSYRTVLGSGALGYADHYVYIGNSSVNTIEGTPFNYTTSDERFKYDLSEKDIIGLDFIKNLRPVDYDFESKKFEEHICKDLPDSVLSKRLNKKFNNQKKKRESGFIAQEVEKAMEKTGYNFHGLKKPAGESDVYKISYGVFVVPLVKAVQEQQQLILSAGKNNDDLENRINENQSYIQALISNNGLSNNIINFSNGNVIDQECRISLSIPHSFQNAFIGIYNLSGKQMSYMPIEMASKNVIINTKLLASGIYNVSVITDEEIISTKAILLKHN